MFEFCFAFIISIPLQLNFFKQKKLFNILMREMIFSSHIVPFLKVFKKRNEKLGYHIVTRILIHFAHKKAG